MRDHLGIQGAVDFLHVRPAWQSTSLHLATKAQGVGHQESVYKHTHSLTSTAALRSDPSVRFDGINNVSDLNSPAALSVSIDRIDSPKSNPRNALGR